MKRVLTTTLAAAAAAAAFAAPAQAVTVDYCEQTLRGQAGWTWGPVVTDNDIKFMWDRFEVAYGYNIVSSRRISSRIVDANVTRIEIAYATSTNAKIAAWKFECRYFSPHYRDAPDGYSFGAALN